MATRIIRRSRRSSSGCRDWMRAEGAGRHRAMPTCMSRLLLANLDLGPHPGMDAALELLGPGLVQLDRRPVGVRRDERGQYTRQLTLGSNRLAMVERFAEEAAAERRNRRERVVLPATVLEKDALPTLDMLFRRVE